MNLEISGLIMGFVGSVIFILVSFFGVGHQKNFIEKWTKRYRWQGWRPIFKISPPNEKPYWKIKWTSTVVRFGAIPPQHQWNMVGFLYIFVGLLLQLMN